MITNYTLIDYSSHLPGPYACHLLAQKGLRVIKPIAKDKKMPFQKMDEKSSLVVFKIWFEKFNENKEIIFYESEEELQDIFKKANGIITNIDKLNLPQNLIKTQIVSSLHDSLPRHDLNVLASSGFLSHHIEIFKTDEKKSLSPPTLPWAGVLFAKDIALTHMSQILQNEKEKIISLEDSFYQNKNALLPHELKIQSYLHSGALPCYRLYKLKDSSWIALACIEAKYWNSFSSFFNLNLKEEDRFDESRKVTTYLESFFSTLKAIDIDDLKTQDFCLTKIKNA